MALHFLDRSAEGSERLGEVLVKAALAAADEIMQVYAAPECAATLKSDESPVTAADLRAEAAILPILREAYPSIPIVAEEEVAAGRIPATDHVFFLVDALDGTREFLSRNGEFTVNIALVEDGVPVAGVVCAPALEEIYLASGSHAWRGRIRAGAVEERAPLVARAAPAAVVAMGSRSHGSPETEAWLGCLKVERFVARGSSLKFCLLAAGEADVYPRFGRTMEWDTAAGDAILRAAGGVVVDTDGRPLRYNKRGRAGSADFVNGHFVAFADPGLAARCIGKE